MTDSNRGCVAKLSFSCPLKGHYCLYAKSCFNLTSRQPHLWIHIMLLHLQVHRKFGSGLLTEVVLHCRAERNVVPFLKIWTSFNLARKPNVNFTLNVDSDSCHFWEYMKSFTVEEISLFKCVIANKSSFVFPTFFLLFAHTFPLFLSKPYLFFSVILFVSLVFSFLSLLTRVSPVSLCAPGMIVSRGLPPFGRRRS